MSGSKTYYYVSSTTFPLFDRTKVADQFQSAVIDQTINSTIELSEYLKNHYRTSKLWNFRNFISWCKTSGFNSVLGSSESYFYTNADISNSTVAAAIKNRFTLGANDTFGVNSAVLDFFSSDFWVKHLATQQGKANLFGSAEQEDYTITFPTDTTIKATFKNGQTVEGSLPTYSNGTRFLEISYSIDRVTETEVTPEGSTEPVKVVDHNLEYGYYMYQEGSGIPALDVVMKNNGIKAAYTFFPVIPLRSNTAWLWQNARVKAGSALKHLGIIAERTADETAYWTLVNSLEKGMTQGNMGDIDYITYIPGININTRDKSSQRYLFEFFYNAYYNCALAYGEEPAHINDGRCTYNGHNIINSSSSKLSKLFKTHNYTRNFYRSFSIYNGASNLNLTYQWAGADYYDNNGTFKPNAKPGDYGVLAGKYEYKYVTLEPKLDSEGNVVKTGNSEDGYEIVYEKVTHYTDYNLVFFCHQVSKNRWKAVAFVDLWLKNLVYHGEYVDTSAYDAVKDSSRLGNVLLDFSDDFTGAVGDDAFRVLTMQYVEYPGDDDSAFVVPLELTTFTEVGAVCQYQMVSICHYLIYNCWVKVKKKWYQRGFFSVVISFAGMLVGFAFSCLPVPIIHEAGLIAMTYFATMLSMTLSAWTMNMSLHLLQKIFGEQVGTSVYEFIVDKLVNIVCTILINYCGFIGLLVATGIRFNVTAGTALNNGESQWVAFRKGAIAGGVTFAAGYASQRASYGTSEALGPYANTIAGEMAVAAVGAATYVGINALGQNLIAGQSFGTALKGSLKSGVIAGAFAAANVLANRAFQTFFPQTDAGSQGQSIGTESTQATPQTNWEIFKNALWSEVVKNPSTYVNLINMADDVRTAHKIQNLESDFEEFNNELESANKLLASLEAQMHSLVTAQASLRLQQCIGRLTTMFPEVNIELTWDHYRTLALATGIDHCKVALGGPSAFVSNALTLDGYTPSSLYFTDTDYTLTWDN